MFLTHFKLTSQPFAERLAADALWQDDRMRQGVARLRYVVEQATIGLLTGASGVGKSALLKRFVHELPRPQHQPVYVHLTRLPSSALLKLVVTELGEVPRRGKERLFQQILEKARQLEGTLVLILDEAHLLDGDALTDIRLLISSALDDAPPLKGVLAGREPLRHTLRQSQHTALLNRIAVRHHLSSLSKMETATYIDFQIKRAGGSEKLFDSAAKELCGSYDQLPDAAVLRVDEATPHGSDRSFRSANRGMLSVVLDAAGRGPAGSQVAGKARSVRRGPADAA